jgi:hypothetical protein
MRKKSLRSDKGFLTVDFMLAMIVTLGCMMLLLRITVSLVSVQMAQYIVYATARAHSAADVSRQDQIANGEEKYKKLLSNAGIMAGFLSPGSTIDKRVALGDHSDIYNPSPEYVGDRESGTPFVGARTEIKLPRLGFSVPFLGRTSEQDEEFKANVNAMMFREPTNRDCHQFFQMTRYQTILNLDPRFRKAAGYASEYVPQEDSGC